MIHILVGNDVKKRSAHLSGLAKDREVIRLSLGTISEEELVSYASNISLFGSYPVITLENILRSGDVALSPNTLTQLAESPTIFIFLEDKMLAAEEKKYKKYATVEKFEEKAVKAAPKVNIFAITDAYERKDKIGAWTLYLSAIDAGTEPEAISGILFWKIKSLLLSGSRTFSREKLVHQSAALVALYHDAHRGELDMTIGLEQFILSALS